MTNKDKFLKGRETSQKHKSMICQVAEIKLQFNRMSKTQKEQLNQLFKEAKWFKNYCISQPDIFDVDDKVKEVDVVKGKGLITEELTLLSSTMKQKLLSELQTSCKAMATNKKNGHSDKNGKLKFKSECNEIPLKQYNNSFYIDFANNRIEIQKIKGSFYCHGLEQIPYEAEITNAQFLRKASGYYLHIIYYMNHKISKSKKPIGHGQIGIDFGIEHNLITSEGEILDCKFEITKGIKLAQRRFNKYISKLKKLGLSLSDIKSHNHYWNLKTKLNKAFEKLTNKKIDKSNKIVANLLRENDLIVIQNELIHKWMSGLFGKQVSTSCMGLIKAELMKSSKVLTIESSFPSTQLCPICGEKTKHDLYKRTYKCEHCGYEHPNRDVKAAETLLNEGLNRLFGTKSNLKESPEKAISTTNSSIISKKSPMIQEGAMLQHSH